MVPALITADVTFPFRAVTMKYGHQMAVMLSTLIMQLAQLTMGNIVNSFH